MRYALAAMAMLCGWSAAGNAGSIEEALKKLDPEERAHQACAIKGMDTLRRDKRLPGADRVKSSIATPALFDGKVVTAKGGAVREKGRWYGLEYTCTVTSDQMKATSFIYVIGKEIPEAKWEQYGLWR
jgi:Domain of Unknown Function (DUF930)